MKLPFQYTVLTGLLLLVFSCGVLVNRDIECRPFALSEELYWPSESLGENIKFFNDSGDSLVYTIVDKAIDHRTDYVSDTGCGCLDFSRMLFTQAQDSIWFILDSRYVENQDADPAFNFVFVINGTKTVFTKDNATGLNNFTIGGESISDLQKYDIVTSNPQNVKKAYLANGLGLVSFEKDNGQIWTNENLTDVIQTIQSSFEFTETICN